ncbi:MAG: serine/threonine protein kinase [Planctomycetota bacterium]|nr:MAG: serine/threonine protein kinase [Planctomycetota bacterium]
MTAYGRSIREDARLDASRHRCWLPAATAGLLVALLGSADTPLAAADWPRFLGPNGRAIAATDRPPLKWSDSQNLRWKAELPGAGASSPIIAGGRVFVTSYSGYGAGFDGRMEDLKRHLSCFDAETGKLLWQQTIPAELPEDPYQGFLTEHGYASNTPVTDGERVFAFFGKSGVWAFDTGDGKRLWHTDVGHESSNRRWGSAASPILFENLVIVNASEESQSIRALDKNDGHEVWRAEAALLELAYSTPAVGKSADGREELVVGTPGEVWGLNPRTGKLLWYAEAPFSGNLTPSVIIEGDVAYLFGGFRGSGSIAVRLGGSGDVTDSHVLWTSRESSYVATPVLYQGHFYWIDDRGIAHCMDTKTGRNVYQTRVALDAASRRGRPVYASPVVADGRVYVVTRLGGTVVLPAAPKYELLAVNRFADDSMFNGTPAVWKNRLYLRSDRALYCVGE